MNRRIGKWVELRQRRRELLAEQTRLVIVGNSDGRNWSSSLFGCLGKLMVCILSLALAQDAKRTNVATTTYLTGMYYSYDYDDEHDHDDDSNEKDAYEYDDDASKVLVGPTAFFDYNV